MSRMGELYQEIQDFLEANELYIKSGKYYMLDVSMLSKAKY
jgi:hypothetical protein